MTSFGVFNKKEQTLLIKKQGEFFGYPSCCSNSFIRFFFNRDKYPRNELQSKYSKEGFVPCSKHAKLLNKDQNRLIVNDLI